MAQWIAACEADGIDLEDVIPFEHDGRDYAIYRSPADVYYATDGHCTHEKTLLCDGLVSGGIIECPKHNGRFDYTSGKALGAPVLVDVRTYPVKVTDGTVYIDLEGRKPLLAFVTQARRGCLRMWPRQESNDASKGARTL